MDTIRIGNLEVWTHIGVPDEERQTEQRLLVTAEMETDLQEAGKKDDVKHSIDYFDVRKKILSLANKPRKTLEALAQDIAQTLLKAFKAETVTVEVKKFIFPDTTCVSVKIVRK